MEKKVSKLQWLDYLNGKWLKSGHHNDLYSRQGTQKLFESLVENKEVCFVFYKLLKLF